LGDFGRAEALLRKLAARYPQQLLFQRQLARIYLDEKRPDEAEKELRAMVAGHPGNVEAGLDLVRFLNTVKGPAAARAELASLVRAGGDVFPYQMLLAGISFAEGNVAESVRILESLAAGTGAPEQALSAKVKLAELQFGRKNFEAAEAAVS